MRECKGNGRQDDSDTPFERLSGRMTFSKLEQVLRVHSSALYPKKESKIPSPHSDNLRDHRE